MSDLNKIRINVHRNDYMSVLENGIRRNLKLEVYIKATFLLYYDNGIG